MAPQNPLTTHGNDKTMNLNSLILTNIQSSPYFKVNLYELKTYHEVIDEIYFKVGHLEPWEKGSRKTAGQTGMCGGVRGVGAGGIVSSAFCLLYKLFTLKLTKKQVIGLITHVDSPYIRGLGFMFIRYTQPPGDLWDWYVDYLEDEEEIDVKAGGGHTITVGEMVRQFLTKLEWYSTLFPRIPVPIQKDIQKKMADWEREHGGPLAVAEKQPVEEEEPVEEEDQSGFGEAERISQLRTSPKRAGRDSAKSSPPYDITKEIDREKEGQKDSKDRERHKHRESRDKERHRESRDNDRHRDTDRHRDKHREDKHREDKQREEKHREHKHSSRTKDHRRSRSPRDRKEKPHRSRSRERKKSRSRDRKERAASPPPRSSRDHHKKSSHRDRERREREDSYERDYHKKSDRDRYEKEDSYERALRREKARQKSEKNGY